MNIRIITSFILLLVAMSISAQESNKSLVVLEKHGIQLDSIDKSWLESNTSFLLDMESLVRMDTSSMNRAIIQMSTKLLSNDLTDLSKEEAMNQKELITSIIHGALDEHRLTEEKKLSAMSWYHMIAREIKI